MTFSFSFWTKSGPKIKTDKCLKNAIMIQSSSYYVLNEDSSGDFYRFRIPQSSLCKFYWRKKIQTQFSITVITLMFYINHSICNFCISIYSLWISVHSEAVNLECALFNSSRVEFPYIIWMNCLVLTQTPSWIIPSPCVCKINNRLNLCW